MRHFLRCLDLSTKDLDQLLSLSSEVREDPHGHGRPLEGEVAALYFAKPSTRTRLSLAAAVKRLGGDPMVLGADELQLGRGEPIEDTAAVVSRYAALFTIRTYEHSEVERFASASTIPTINALTDLHHPCQALADLFTIRSRFDTLDGVTVAYLGDGNNVAHSLLEAGVLAGMTVRIATPEQLRPEPDIVDEARRRGEDTGGSVEVLDDPHEAVAGAQAVYTDVWLSMGDPEEEQDERRQLLEPYRVDSSKMSEAAGDAIFMHCLPAHRGDEVTADVIDGPRSVVFDQAENRMHTAQALMIALLDGSLEGPS